MKDRKNLDMKSIAILLGAGFSVPSGNIETKDVNKN